MDAFESGSRVCFVGDSLVAQNIALPWIVEGYRRSFPERDVYFFNCGIAGGTAEYALRVLNDDVLSRKPTHVVIAFGINDSSRWLLSDGKRSAERYRQLSKSFDIYKKSISKLCDKVLKNNIRLILCTPAPYDEYGDYVEEALKGGYALMSEYAAFIRCFAKDNGYQLCDYHREMVKLMQTDELYNSDRVHPTLHGYYCMANIFLALQGISVPEETDLKEKFPIWIDAVTKYRCIFSAEKMIINAPELSTERKLNMAKKLLETTDEKPIWADGFAKQYLKYKPIEEELLKTAESAYTNEVLKKR